MQDYSLELALFDYLPVAMSALGLALLAQLLSRVLPAALGLLLVGAGLVVAGGLGKATWKLIWVLTGRDVAWLDASLFICMAPGMILLACHVFVAIRRWRGKGARAHAGRASLLIALPVLAVAGLAAGFAQGKAWFFLLLAATALANIALVGALVRLSWIWGRRGAAAIFLFSISLTLCLSVLAPVSAGKAPLQWLAESLNLLAQGGFALGLWRLRSAAPAYEDNG